MEKEEFFKQYQTREWYELSKRIKARDNNTCQMCGRNDIPLSVHHLYYPKNGDITEVDDFSLITLCDRCHNIQKDSKSIVKEELESLRIEYTDYELSCILKAVIRGKFKQSPYPHITIDVTETLPPDEHPVSYLEKLSEWRRKINM